MRTPAWRCRLYCCCVLVVVLLFSGFGSALAAPCPECPSGCVPREMVESLRVEADDLVDTCPTGCVSIIRVKSFLDTPRCSVSPPDGEAAPSPVVTTPTTEAPPEGTTQEGAAAPVPQTEQEAERAPYVANTRHRLVSMPTSIGLEKGKTAITGYGFGLWEFQHGVTDEVQVGIMTLLPVLVTALAPTVRVHGQVSENFHLSAGVFGSWFHYYNSDFHVLFGGGSVEGTFRSGRHTFNLGMVAMSGGYSNRQWHNLHDYRVTVWNAWDAVLLLPHLGYRLELADIWSLQLEFMPLLWLSTKADQPTRTENFTALIFYGFRVHGNLLYGDFGFCIPASEWYGDWLWQYTPLGLPYFSLGFYF